MMQWSWRQAFYCITGILGKEENDTCEPFTRSCCGRISPLYWRVPILVWALVIMFWSISFFWGPTEKFFLYMTHWGLAFIILESFFGIFVAIGRRGFTVYFVSVGEVRSVGCVCGMACKSARAQCGWRMCRLEHPSPSNFYVSCWQGNRSAAPLLLLRGFLFLFSTCVLLASIAVPLTLDIYFGYWFIYLTHWGFLLIVLNSGFGTAVSAYAYFKKPIDATFGLPWYVKTYWILYNITIPVAFLITVFYWGILRTSPSTVNFAPNPVLDVMLHGVNSAVMMVELVCSAHPSRLLHIMQPLYFAGAYMLFSVIYYFAGGLDPWGNPFIYPVVDWSKPEQTMVVITLTALFLALMHLLTVGIAAARDAIAKRGQALPAGVYNDAFTP